MTAPAQSSLFDGQPEKPRSNDRPEAAALVEVLMALKSRESVAWCERQNSGATKVGKRFIRFGWPGCSDVVGQMRDGRFLAVEVKSAKGKPRPEQAIFLATVREAGGLAFVARNCLDVGQARPALEHAANGL